MKNTIENNKLIAEFMEYKINNFKGDNYYQPTLEPYVYLTDGTDSIDELHNFESSWDWLMPVVEKIESLNLEVNNVLTSFDVTISYQYCQIIDEDGLGICGINTHSKDNKSKIEAVYKAVIEFIKWYNENK